MNIDNIIKKFTSLPTRDKITTAATFLLISLIVPYMFLYSPSDKKVRIKQSELQNLKKNINDLSLVLSVQASPPKKPVEEQTALPEIEDLGGMLASISREASSAGVDFVSIAPEAVNQKDGFTEMHIKLDMRVKFKDLYNFMSRLQAKQPVFLARELKYETNDTLYPSGMALIKGIAYLKKK